MTAEIAIMNREAVALASDSAVTARLAGGQKIFTSATKIFSVPNRPIGIMVYNSASFMEVPWETIITTYISCLSENTFETLELYANNLLAFLEEENLLFPKDAQKRYFRNFVSPYFFTMRTEIENEVQSIISIEGAVDETKTQQIVSKVIEKHRNQLQNVKLQERSSISVEHSKEIVRNNNDTFQESVKAVFQKLPIIESSMKDLSLIVENLFSKASSDDYSGVVISGFGGKETFPALYSFIFEGIASGRLKYRPEVNVKVSHNNRSWIIPFAQREMVNRFMEGVDPSYRQFERGYLSQLCKQFAEKVVESITGYEDDAKKKLSGELLKVGEALVKDFDTRMAEFITNQFVKPITAVVSILPKKDLSLLAESLVSLTSQKRRFSLEPETVSEPIDVAVISKKDGFVWIKKKQYFQAELNP